MQIDFDPAIDDFTVTQVTFGKIVGLKERQVRNLRDEGVIVEIGGKISLKESLPRYFATKSGQVFDDENEEMLDERELDKKIKLEDYRSKRYKNELDKGQSVRKKDFLPFFRQWSKHTGREFDSIEGSIDGSLIECPDCKKQMKLDGRGKEKIKKTVIRMKNYLHDLHENVESAKSSK